MREFLKKLRPSGRKGETTKSAFGLYDDDVLEFAMLEEMARAPEPVGILLVPKKEADKLTSGQRILVNEADLKAGKRRIRTLISKKDAQKRGQKLKPNEWVLVNIDNLTLEKGIYEIGVSTNGTGVIKGGGKKFIRFLVPKNEAQKGGERHG